MMSWRAAWAAKQSPCLPGDCFPYATLHHAPLAAGGTCASLAVTYVESVGNRATFVLRLLRGHTVTAYHFQSGFAICRENRPRIRKRTNEWLFIPKRGQPQVSSPPGQAVVTSHLQGMTNSGSRKSPASIIIEKADWRPRLSRRNPAIGQGGKSCCAFNRFARRWRRAVKSFTPRN